MNRNERLILLRKIASKPIPIEVEKKENKVIKEMTDDYASNFIKDLLKNKNEKLKLLRKNNKYPLIVNFLEYKNKKIICLDGNNKIWEFLNDDFCDKYMFIQKDLKKNYKKYKECIKIWKNFESSNGLSKNLCKKIEIIKDKELLNK